MRHKTQPQPSGKKVVIIGAGFGGLAAAQRLAASGAEVTLIDRRNYHLFQPLLYQIATADLSPAHVAWPIRSIFSKTKNVSVVLSRVEDIDLENKTVIGDTGSYDYDYLIIANGSQHSYFGNEHWEKDAPGLKRVSDATELRKRILMAFERAETAPTKELQQRELTFVIVGGGPTGVEMAGGIAELANSALAADFRNISPSYARIMLVESGDALLKAFPDKLRDNAKRALERLGVEVHLGCMVNSVNEKSVTINEVSVPSSTVIWAAGVAVKDTKDWLKCETDRSGRIPVREDLSVADYPEVFVIGDAAKVEWKDGRDVPGIAPAAKQMGRYVARVISAKLQNKPKPKRFRYRHLGNLATIGRHSAVIDMGKLQLSGGFAWWLWGLAHIYFLIGARSPVLVASNWLWSYLTYSKGARLITHAYPKAIRVQRQETGFLRGYVSAEKSGEVEEVRARQSGL